MGATKIKQDLSRPVANEEYTFHHIGGCVGILLSNGEGSPNCLRSVLLREYIRPPRLKGPSLGPVGSSREWLLWSSRLEQLLRRPILKLLLRFERCWWPLKITLVRGRVRACLNIVRRLATLETRSTLLFALLLDMTRSQTVIASNSRLLWSMMSLALLLRLLLLYWRWCRAHSLEARCCTLGGLNYVCNFL